MPHGSIATYLNLSLPILLDVSDEVHASLWRGGVVRTEFWQVELVALAAGDPAPARDLRVLRERWRAGNLPVERFDGRGQVGFGGEGDEDVDVGFCGEAADGCGTDVFDCEIGCWRGGCGEEVVEVGVDCVELGWPVRRVGGYIDVPCWFVWVGEDGLA